MLSSSERPLTLTGSQPVEQLPSDLATTTVLAVVIPAYRAAATIGSVIEAMPDGVSHIVVVNDASPDALSDVLEAYRGREPRLHVVTNRKNMGVGGAVKAGFEEALRLGSDIVVKVDADGQMDPALIPHFVMPLVRGEADITKGNRFAYLGFIRRMPVWRRFGNIGLSFLTKAASGYWHGVDPTNGYLAVTATVLREMDRTRLADSYFFETSFLCEAYFTRALLKDVPMRPVYGDEVSSMKPGKMVFHFLPKLAARFFYRLFMNYFVWDFNAVSIFVVAGLPALLFGLLWSGWHWYHASVMGVKTSTGTVFIGAMAILIGFQLMLQATVLDVENEPGRTGRNGSGRPRPPL